MAGDLAGSVDARAATWLDAVADLLAEPLTSFPVEEIMGVFADTFAVDGVAFGWTDREGRVRFHVDPPDCADHLERGLVERPELWRAHPLARWYFDTLSLEPQTLDRVPASMAAARPAVKEFMRELGLVHQLAVPLGPRGNYYTVTVARADRDFSDADLEVAARAQAALRGLKTQIDALGRLESRCPPDLSAAGLTRRELAVLGLVAEGLTATAVAHQLGISPRTVHKHLEHAYRKLGVGDRITAIRQLDQASTSPW